MPFRQYRIFIWDITIAWPAPEHLVEVALLEINDLMAPAIDTLHITVALLQFFPAEILAAQAFPNAVVRAALQHGAIH